MNSTSAPSLSAAGPAVPSVGELAQDLAALDGELHAMHRATVKVVEYLGRVLNSGIVEELEGLPIDGWLALRSRMIGCDRSTLITTADVLRHMPITWAAFVNGELSFGIVRNIAKLLGRRSRADRYAVDARIGETARQWDGLDVYGPDRLLAVIERAVWELDPVEDRERAEDAAEKASYVAVQPSFDGRVAGGFELDVVGGATVLNGLDAATPDGPASTLAQRRAQGLVILAETFLAGGRPGGAKPTVVVNVDLAQITATAAGVLDLQVPGGIAPTLTARTLDILAADADLQAVIFDGHRPLTVTASGPRRTSPPTFGSRCWRGTWWTGSPARTGPSATCTTPDPGSRVGIITWIT